MAFIINDLDNVGVGHGNGPKIATYVTDDASSVVQTDGYFDEAADALETGDMIACKMAADEKLYTISVSAQDISLVRELKFGVLT